MSYANLVLYGASLPTYVPKKDDDKTEPKGGKETSFFADDPANREKVDNFFKSIRN